MTQEKTIEILQDLWRYEKVKYTDKEVREAIEMAIKALEKRKTGRWIREYQGRKTPVIDKNGKVQESCFCSKCGDWLTASDEYDCRGYYCPNCGAKMEVDR